MISPTVSEIRNQYLDTLKLVLTGALDEENDIILGGTTKGSGGMRARVAHEVGSVFSKLGFELVYKRPYDPAIRELGRDWPSRGLTMIGFRRMENIRACVESVIDDGIEGDLIETGVWRGGAAIYMKAILRCWGADDDRVVWCADSFEGLPQPDPHRYPADANDPHHKFEGLRVGVDQVKANFQRLGMLDGKVKFLVGWFSDTLASAPIEKLSVLRMDGDMYSSTIQAFEALYSKLSPGGYCIVDDYGNINGCRQAVLDYRTRMSISEPIVDIDGFGAFWRKDS